MTERVAYHDSCAGLRELGSKTQPRRLSGRGRGADAGRTDRCGGLYCGFGGLFATKYARTLECDRRTQADDIRGVKADTVLAGDLGCLMNMRATSARGLNVKARQSRNLAGMADGPAIGEGKPEAARDGSHLGQSKRTRMSADRRQIEGGCHFRAISVVVERPRRPVARVRALRGQRQGDQGSHAPHLDLYLEATKRRFAGAAARFHYAQTAEPQDMIDTASRWARKRHQGQVDDRRGDQPPISSRGGDRAESKPTSRVTSSNCARRPLPHHCAAIHLTGKTSRESQGARRSPPERSWPSRTIAAEARQVCGQVPGARRRHNRRTFSSPRPDRSSSPTRATRPDANLPQGIS